MGWIGALIALVGVFIVLIIVKAIKNMKDTAEKVAYLKRKTEPETKYCCNLKMHFSSIDCNMSGGGTREFYICYICRKQEDVDNHARCDHTGGEQMSVQNRVDIGVSNAMVSSMKSGKRW